MSEPTFSAGNSSPAVGDTIGKRYRVLRRIGEGGMGIVVEAENVVTGKRVAIKWMHPQVSAQAEAAERFLREARASSRVRHPNVVDVYDAVHDGDSCFLVMELLEGEPLSFILERGGMPAHELIGLLVDAMRGVVAAHKQGVIHRDIKPDNIFLAIESDHGPKVPKVLDFGISKVMGPEATSLTRTGATMGTPMYMSYEQLCGVKDIDLRTDVYAFGVVLYEALTGLPPYQAGNLPQLVAKMTHTVPVPARQLRPDIPEALDRLIQRAMAKERESRIPSLEVLIAELKPFASAQAFDSSLPLMAASAAPVARAAAPLLIVAGRESAPIPTPMQASVAIPAAPRRRDGLLWLIAAGVIATVVGVLTAYGRLKPEATVDGVAGADAAPAAVGGGSAPETNASGGSGEVRGHAREAYRRGENARSEAEHGARCGVGDRERNAKPECDRRSDERGGSAGWCDHARDGGARKRDWRERSRRGRRRSADRASDRTAGWARRGTRNHTRDDDAEQRRQRGAAIERNYASATIAHALRPEAIQSGSPENRRFLTRAAVPGCRHGLPAPTFDRPDGAMKARRRGVWRLPRAPFLRARLTAHLTHFE